MRNRTILSLMLFVALSFLFFSLYAFLLAFVIKDDPVADAAKISAAQSKGERSDEMIYFGSKSEDASSNNIFDASMRQVVLSSEQYGETFSGLEEITVESIIDFLDHPERCPALPDYVLLGTAFAIPESESFISLGTTSGRAKGRGRGPVEAAPGPEIMILRIDDEVDTGITLAGIRRNLAAFRTNAGVRCLGDNVGKEQSMAEPNVPQEKQVAGDDQLNVQQVGPNAYRLSREDLNRVTANLNSLATEARIVPDRKENGFKIFSIRPGGLYQKIGIQNGDVVKSINGIELSSPDKALEAYSRLRNANKLSLDIVRRGKQESLEYSID